MLHRLNVDFCEVLSRICHCIGHVEISLHYLKYQRFLQGRFAGWFGSEKED